MYDVIVVGARCAGAATALLLARQGHRVLLVDRNTFPSDHILSNHMVWQPGIARLQRWGLLDALVRSGCPPISTATIDVGPFALTGRFPAYEGVAEAYAPRRLILDQILVEATTRAGVELWEGCTVDELLVSSDVAGQRVSGIRGHRNNGGGQIQARATVVVAADGMRSRLAEQLDAPKYAEHPALSGTYFTYWSGLPIRVPTLYPRSHRTIAAYPTHDDLTVVSVDWAIADYRAVRRDIAGAYFSTIAEHAPELYEALQQATREARWIGTAVPNYFRRPYGPGWALVGDAGYLKDPGTAQGITDAFAHAELLASALDGFLRGERGYDDALADYEQQRNAAVGDMYAFTVAQAALAPPTPEEQELFAALQNDPDLFELFLGVYAGAVPVADFFGPPAAEAAA